MTRLEQLDQEMQQLAQKLGIAEVNHAIVREQTIDAIRTKSAEANAIRAQFGENALAELQAIKAQRAALAQAAEADIGADDGD